MPSATREGPKRISSSVPTVLELDPLAARAGVWCASAPQWKPRPGASVARAKGEPIMTASAPQAIALAMSPDLPIEPSAMTWT